MRSLLSALLFAAPVALAQTNLGGTGALPPPVAPGATSARPAPPRATTPPRPAAPPRPTPSRTAAPERPPAAAGQPRPATPARPANPAARRAPPTVAAPAAIPAPAPPPPTPAAPPAPRIGAATGLPLPRYAALGSNLVNLRVGPDLRYPIEWTYQRRDLPVQITDEHQHWRRIRDPDGTEGWVQRPLLHSRARTFIIQGREDRTLRRRPEDAAPPVAQLRPGVVGRLRQCDAGAAWCEAQVGDYRGWIRRADIWGVAADEDIR